jgi:RNA polymerase sigma-70 factor (ECF subfamily)
VDTLWLNGAVGGRILLDGELNTVISFVVEGSRITRMYAVRNPHKLSGLANETVLAR